MVTRKYGVILADPPWDYKNGGNGSARDHYPLMTIDQLCALPVGNLAADDCLLLLWATWPHVEGAMRVINAWGFEYVTGFPWVKLQDHPVVDMFGEFRAKPTFGVGAWVRGCSEPVFIARRGNVKPPTFSFVGLLSKRMEHSRKPENIHQYAMTFDGPYLELFARRSVPGWDVWGNEVKTDIDLTTLELKI